ncbi:MarR family winged helix-turn-helix transcriptional regulator [Leptospira jelokensis]|uniref:MarR family winged helix-turn-helix transcriptional regulator n=1 Tax=Leptospira jelokensis TaxID=2484931 RepID=UPI001091774B|nr:MarR family transcriptional regulator [Leptospira jelokensis]TGM01927.1 MarR family transcriptional regulator [Leptospira jelokensis]
MAKENELRIQIEQKILEMSLGHLITTSSRIIFAMYEAAQKQLEITPPRSGILILLDELGELSQSQICDFLFLEKTNVSVLLRELEKEGLVTIKKDSKDKRTNLVHISAKGKKMIARLNEINQEISAKISKNLSQTEKKFIKSYFQELLLSQIPS